MANFIIGIYDSRTYDELLKKSFNKELLTPEEENYLRFCYHYEEYQAGLL
jgi:hypothetical protein